jgi:HD-like signal output (HDOD) protein
VVGSPREMVQNGPKLATQPLIYERLLTAIQDPRSRSTDIARVLSEDPGLSVRLLKVVNSAFFAFPQKIETVSQAVTVVGTSQIRDLALATSVINAFKDVPPDLVDMAGFWSHSLACGVGARVMAGHLREHNVERYFVAGLIHDVGRLVMYLRQGAEARLAIERSREKGIELHRAEREVFGFDHAQVGACLLESWNLPGCFSEAVAYHHEPVRAKEYPLETATVHVADIMANAFLPEKGGQAKVPSLKASAWDLLSLDHGLLPLILEEVERQHRAAVQAIMGFRA